MSIPVVYYTFVDGKTDAGKITAARLNGNFSALFDWANGNIEDDNVKAGAKIICSDRSYTGASKILGTWEFNVFPTIPAASIADSKLSSNVALKNINNSFSVKQTLTSGVDFNKVAVENMVVENLVGLPAWQASDRGRFVYDSTAGKGYIGGNSAWLEITYIGGYTGGAIRSYCSSGVTDSGNSHKMYFKTEVAPTSVKVIIKGEPYPDRFYTELGAHTHAFTADTHAHSVSDPTHTHVFTGTAHTHGLSDPGHNHAFTGTSHTHTWTGDSHTHTLSDPTHTHTTTLGSHWHNGTFGSSNHTHAVSGTTGAATSTAHTHTGDLHAHGGVAQGTYNTDQGGGGATGSTSVAHTHGFSATSGTPSATASTSGANLGTPASSASATGCSVVAFTVTGAVGSATAAGTNTAAATGVSCNNATAAGTNAASPTSVGIGSTVVTGTNASTGVSAGALSTFRKLYGDHVNVVIDGVNKTSAILAMLGWTMIGDGTGTHAFHTVGTGELEIVSLISAGQVHTLELTEPTAGYGCSLAIHIESY